MLLALVLAAHANPAVAPATPPRPTATTVAGLTATLVKDNDENAWATFPVTLNGAQVTATAKCRNGSGCTILHNTTKIGTASIQPIETGGFILHSSLSSGGVSSIVDAVWKPEGVVAAAVEASTGAAH